MARPYSQDLRDRILRASQRGMKTKQIAVAFSVSPAWVRRVNQRLRETGETSARPMGSRGIVIVDRSQLAALVGQHPDATLVELRTMLGVSCALSTLCMALKKMGFSFKKNDPRRRARPSGRCPTPRAMAGLVAARRSATINFYR